jgi:hypothetical protein
LGERDDVRVGEVGELEVRKHGRAGKLVPECARARVRKCPSH